MDGFLLVDKPAGMTSHDVVDAVRRLAKTRRVGHAGTLDPFATGLLILGIGKATKELGKLVGLDKTYEATLTLGATSDTFDTEGKITPFVVPAKAGTHPMDSRFHGNDKSPTSEEIEKALDRFRGGYEQKAPLHSAKKVDGKKLYNLARAGLASEKMRPIKHVSIYKLQATSYDPPRLSLFIQCSSGTYIRSLADDIGRELGVGAYCSALRRTAIGTVDSKSAVPLDQLKREGAAARIFSSILDT